MKSKYGLKSLLIIILSLVVSVKIMSQNRVLQTVVIDEKLIEFETLDGRLDGAFNVYNADTSSGKKRILAEGHIKNNCRSGIWKIYHPKNIGEVVLEREYTSLFRYKMTKYPMQNNSLVGFIHNNLNPYLGFDSLNCRKLDYISAANVQQSNRFWRELTKEKNALLFSERLTKEWNKIMQDENVKIYGTDDFKYVLEERPVNISTESIISFRIKEDYVFDKNRLIGEYRILGLAPVIYDSLTRENREIGWFYYPQIRSSLVKVNLEFENEQINVDEVFLNRIFSSFVYKTSRINSDENTKTTNHYLDLSMLLFEHNCWLFYAGYLTEIH
jgi:hypothetical protein